MAKMTTTRKTNYKSFKKMMDAQGEYAFLFCRALGVSAMVVFTGRPRNHVRIVVAHCGEKDTFKKKIGFVECVGKLEGNEGIVLPAMPYDDLYDTLYAFLELNFSHPTAMWTLM